MEPSSCSEELANFFYDRPLEAQPVGSVLRFLPACNSRTGGHLGDLALVPSAVKLGAVGVLVAERT